MNIFDSIFMFEPRINLVIAWFCYCAVCAVAAFIGSWVARFVVAKYRRMRRLKRLKEVNYVH